MSKQPPERIWLQWNCDRHDESYGNPDPGDATWCENKIFPDDVEYVRADRLEPQS